MATQTRSRLWMQRLTVLAVFLAAGVIMLGAWTRLADAGLGCPDWPGCYGHLDVRKAIEHVDEQNQFRPGALRESHKTVPEMVHRYFASTLGAIIMVIAGLALYRRQKYGESSVLPLFLLALVIFQGMLGMWTVTMKLQPTIVMLHLLGGFTTITLLCLLAARLYRWPRFINDCDVRTLTPVVRLAIVVTVLQIALGGWTAANYAAVACTELPVCEPGWQAKLDFEEAFTFWGHELELDRQDFEFGVLENDARTTIHILHRFGALVVLLVVGGLCLVMFRRARCDFFGRFAATIAALLVAQIALGLSNVIFHIPLAVAVAHNFTGVLLLISLVLFARAIRVQPERRQAP